MHSPAHRPPHLRLILAPGNAPADIKPLALRVCRRSTHSRDFDSLTQPFALWVNFAPCEESLSRKAQERRRLKGLRYHCFKLRDKMRENICTLLFNCLCQNSMIEIYRHCLSSRRAGECGRCRPSFRNGARRFSSGTRNQLPIL